MVKHVAKPSVKFQQLRSFNCGGQDFLFRKLAQLESCSRAVLDPEFRTE